MALSYEYQPLDTNESIIRLLTVLPKTNVNEIAVSLRHVSILEAKQTYDAISYMWGPADKTHRILVDGRSIVVRDNIWQFLNHYCENDLEGKGSPLWIDSICINQANLTEKACQVAMMGQIFQNSRRVLIWLDETSKNNTLTEKEIELVGRTRDILGVQMSKTLWETASQIHKLAGDDKSADQNSARALERIAKQVGCHQYWRRLWIVQETQLAPNDGLKVILGAHLLGPELLGILKRINPRSDEDSWEELHAHASFHNLAPELRTQSSPRRPQTLSSLLRSYCLQLCEDPRDTIFGVLGLIDTSFLAPAAPIKVNYALDAEVLFFDVLHCMLQESEEWASSSTLSCARYLVSALKVTSTSLVQSEQCPTSVVNQYSFFLSVSNPLQPLHRSERTRFQKPPTSQRPRCRRALDGGSAEARRTQLQSWLKSSRGDPWTITDHLWLCRIDGYFPLVIRLKSDGKLEIVGYLFTDDVLGRIFIKALPQEVKDCIQGYCNQNLGEIKDAWDRQEYVKIPCSALHLVQLAELHKPWVRGAIDQTGLS